MFGLLMGGSSAAFEPDAMLLVTRRLSHPKIAQSAQRASPRVLLGTKQKFFPDHELAALELHARRIGTGIHYRALHLHEYYRNTYGYASGDLPNAEWISDRTISLPLSPKLTDEDVDDVINAVTATLKESLR